MSLLIGLCLLAASGYVLGECQDGCNEPTTLLYEDLACRPVFVSSNDCCPSHYDCSHIQARADLSDDKCHFHGRTYIAGESINNDEIYGNCKIGCSCRKKQSGNMGFTCAILDCPEWLGRRSQPECHFKQELDKCCGGDEICPPFSATCEIKGKTYHEGQMFGAPNLKCTECVCQQGFKGKFEAPFCKKRGCIEEVSRQTEIKQFCAPTYSNGDSCCPLTWHCPEDSDIIIPASSLSKNPDLKCKFGNSTLNVGDKFERTSGEKGKLSCECRIPPYVTCLQNFDYPFYAAEY